MVKIVIKIIPPEEEEEIICHIHNISDYRKEILDKLKVAEITYFIGKSEGKFYKITTDDIYYFESVDKKTFIYTKNEEFEIEDRLYILESKLKKLKFTRISKSMIVNIEKITMIRPSFSGRFEAKLENGEGIKISRKYVPDLKKAYGLGDKER
ncbi:LytTR family DNA-binding domain-containing protein [Streptococcaceae bacterium ESL0687]|nr:LytTR family DNA-binding domain-containing protein [Streptococcaceae bacterium ESL0687]